MHEREKMHRSTRWSAQLFRGRALWLYGIQSISLVGLEQHTPIITSSPTLINRHTASPDGLSVLRIIPQPKHTPTMRFRPGFQGTQIHIYYNSAYVFHLKTLQRPNQIYQSVDTFWNGAYYTDKLLLSCQMFAIVGCMTQPHPVPLLSLSFFLWDARKPKL